MLNYLFFIGIIFMMIGIVKKNNKCNDSLKNCIIPYEDFKRLILLIIFNL